MPLFDVARQRITVDHYHVEARSRTEATEKATEARLTGQAPTHSIEISSKLLPVNTIIDDPADAPAIGTIADD